MEQQIKYYKMGTVQPLASIYNGNFKGKNWLVVQRSRKSIPGQPSLVQIQGTQIMADQYIIRLNHPQTFNRQSFIYQKRASSNSSCLVNIFSAQLLTQKYQLSGQNEIVRIRTQRIPWRLNESMHLSFQQGIYILQNALRGFTEIFQYFPQPIAVYDNMIGMTTFGTVRVWINSNFSKNQTPTFHKPISMASMIQSLLLSIEKHLQTLVFPHQVRADILNSYTLNLATFKAANYLLKSKQQKKKIGLSILNKVKTQNDNSYFPTPRSKAKSLLKIHDTKYQDTFNRRMSDINGSNYLSSFGSGSLNINESYGHQMNRNLKNEILTSHKSPDSLLKQGQSRLKSNSIGKDRKNLNLSQSLVRQISQSFHHYNRQQLQSSQNIQKKTLEPNKSVKLRNISENQQHKNNRSTLQSRTKLQYQNKPNNYSSLTMYESPLRQSNHSKPFFLIEKKNFQTTNMNSPPKIDGKNRSYQNFRPTFAYQSKGNLKKSKVNQYNFLNQLKIGNINEKQQTPEHKSPFEMASSYNVDRKTKQPAKDNFISFQVKLQKSGQIKWDLGSPLKKSNALGEIENVDKFQNKNNFNKSPQRPRWNQALKRKN